MRVAFITFLFAVSFVQVAAAGEENRCGMPISQETDELCEGLTHLLPHFAGTFDLAQLDGRYALDCNMPASIKLSGVSTDSNISVYVNGLVATDVFQPKAYFGPKNAPLSFILPISYTDPETGEGRTFSVNGDHQGYYILDDWDGVRRLSKCPKLSVN